MTHGVNEDSGSERNGGNEDATEALAILTDSIGDSIDKGSETYKSLFPSALIYRVPENLRQLDESTYRPYTPRLISIGPFHLGDPHLPQAMKNVKKHFTNYLLFRLHGENEARKAEALRDCVGKMKDRLDEAMKYYAEEAKVNDSEMVEMMVVDGCFILELLYSDHINKIQAEKKTQNGVESSNSKASSSNSRSDAERQPSHPIFDIILTASIIKEDLLLLENQIPYFVLEELFEITVKKIPGENESSLKEYVVSYFDNIIMRRESKNSCSTKETAQERKVSGEQYFHILHLLHEYYVEKSQVRKVSGKNIIPPVPKKPDSVEVKVDQLEGQLLPVPKKPDSVDAQTTLKVRASDLDYAGVKFVPGKEDSPFNVEFKEGKNISWWCRRADFEIPPLNVHDSTEPFLRNLIALEQCCPKVSRHFTSYAQLMDMLIDSEEDVQVLRKAKVIHNNLGKDKDVADLFNNLCKEVVQGEFFFNEMCQKATNYSERLWPKCMAYFIRTYLASPWAFIGFCLAVIAFGIQITNFVRSFLK